MERKGILLFTDWEKGFWTIWREAPYPKKSYTDLSGWDELRKKCPLPGVGIYSKFKKHNLLEDSFVYLRITGMEYDPETLKPTFFFEPIKEADTKSISLINRMSSHHRRLFSAIKSDELLHILKGLNESPPREWVELLREPPIGEGARWREFIGEHFHEIDEANLSNEEFEDRVFQLLKALGFDVKQKGHMVPGEYPDGVALFREFAIVYDCKNTSEYATDAKDKRAIEKYKEGEEFLKPNKQIYPVFIAKSCKRLISNKIHCFSTETLKYLLYKKLILGHEFSLAPIFKILREDKPLTKHKIDKEWIK